MMLSSLTEPSLRGAPVKSDFFCLLHAAPNSRYDNLSNDCNGLKSLLMTKVGFVPRKG
jgi:hypothetical protein